MAGASAVVFENNDPFVPSKPVHKSYMAKWGWERQIFTTESAESAETERERVRILGAAPFFAFDGVGQAPFFLAAIACNLFTSSLSLSRLESVLFRIRASQPKKLT